MSISSSGHSGGTWGFSTLTCSGSEHSGNLPQITNDFFYSVLLLLLLLGGSSTGFIKTLEAEIAVCHAIMVPKERKAGFTPWVFGTPLEPSVEHFIKGGLTSLKRLVALLVLLFFPRSVTNAHYMLEWGKGWKRTVFSDGLYIKTMSNLVVCARVVVRELSPPPSRSATIWNTTPSTVIPKCNTL